MRERMLQIAERLEKRADAIFNNLHREFERVCQLHPERNAPYPKSQMAGALRIFAEEIRETLETVAFREYTGGGDLFTVDEFEGYCGLQFIDSDGEGYYAKKHPGKNNDTMLVSSLPARPSRISGGDVNRDYTHVAWYNR